MTPVPHTTPPSVEFVHHCVATMAERGYRRVITGALSEAEQVPFVQAGFSVADELHVLTRLLGDVTNPVAPPGVHLRRARTSDRPAVVDVDHLSFAAFWRLDASGLDEAIHATPRARFRVAALDGLGPLAGYAICGRAADRGYVQRLAVHPGARRRGVASTLLLDGLRWLQRWGATEAVVNTQETNAAALALYERHGFLRSTSGLRVLETVAAP